MEGGSLICGQSCFEKFQREAEDFLDPSALVTQLQARPQAHSKGSEVNGEWFARSTA